MPFGICAKPSKDDLANEISALVETPNKTHVELVVSRDALGLECLENVAKQLGLTQIGYFGLCYKTKKGHEWWLILEKPIKKQLERNAANGLCNIELKFKIHFFMADSCWMRRQDKPVRNLYYLQLKCQILEGSLACDKDIAVLLASYSAQAELGDYDAEKHTSYLRGQNHLLPFNVIANFSKDVLEQQVINLYQHHRGMTSEDAELEFVITTQQLDGYGDEYYPAKDKDGFIILVGAAFLGIVVRHPHGLPPAYFRWPDIIRMSHNKRYFCIESTKSFDTIQFEMEDAATAKYVWRMFVAHHQFRRLSSAQLASHHRLSSKPVKHSLLNKQSGVVTSGDGNSASIARSVTGLVNPVFDDECQSYTEDRDVVDNVSHDSSSSFKALSTLPRPQSLNLSSVDNRHEFLLHNNLCTSQNSLDQNQGLYSRGLFNSAAFTNGVGSSLSMDSGNPLGTQSLESLDDRIHPSHNVSPGDVCAATNPTARPCRPMSLNLDQIAADTSSEVTGRTSGYSTSNDSDLEESRELDFDDEDLHLSREAQLEELEKILAEGQVFTEFQKVERRSERLTTASAQCGGNLEKNRYKDVVPYEETRVRLNPRNNPSGSDYINADFVKLDVGVRTYSYIATQGPMENTVADFWQMVWEQNVQIIVAATDDKINSKSACHPYWPDDSSGCKKRFGAFEVETLSIRDTSSYKVRTLSLHETSSQHKRIVCHLHFTDWPDHGVPQDPKNFLEFLEEVESARQTLKMRQSHAAALGVQLGPVVVHCTAGVGRTGVVILTDLMIACLQSNERINILKSLIHLRCQRMLLVANFGQYRFVYTTLIHFIRNSRLI